MLFPIRKLFLLLISIVIFLVLMHFFPERLSLTIHDRFNLDTEANIPTWYSTVLLFSVSLSAFALYISKCINGKTQKFWLLLSVVYCYLSMDEAARLHEMTRGYIKWVFVYAPFALAFFIICAYFLINNANKTLSNRILGGLLVYALGGLVGELISYQLYPLPPLLQQLELVLEESFEMLGTIIVLIGCLHELNRISLLDNQKKINT